MDESLTTTSEPAVTRPRLLVVDDDSAIRRQLKWALADEFEVFLAETSEAAWTLMNREKPDVVALDLALHKDDPETGFTLLERFHAVDPLLKIVLVTGRDDKEYALRAVDRGAFDYFTKPVDPDELRLIFKRAVALRRLEVENDELRSRLRRERSLGQILGHSQTIQDVFEAVRSVAGTGVAVLIEGESGTGKELVAKEIHRLSDRGEGPFVSLSCGGTSPEQISAELFGIDDAGEDEPGRIEAAVEGTLFLDEVGELPAEVQARVVREMRERSGARPRLISSTTLDLKEEMKRGRVREDFYFLLNEVAIRVPPLRERKEDIVYLAQTFLDRYGAEFGRRSLSLSREAMRSLQRYAWPGNVRELQHRVQRAVVLSRSRVTRTEDLELSGQDEVAVVPLREAREQIERKVVTESLRRNCGNIARTARELEVSRPTLHDLLRKLDISAREFKDGMGPGLQPQEAEGAEDSA